MRDVDAGAIALVLDTCNSAAAIEGTEFKPGPLGSKGLGQIAYDKRAITLAATQSDDVALEVDQIQQGLLTYALLNDGWEAKNADYLPRDGVIWLSELLSYGVKRVPETYEELQQGKLLLKTRGLDHEPKNLVQRPALFDFTRGKTDVVVGRTKVEPK